MHRQAVSPSGRALGLQAHLSIPTRAPARNTCQLGGSQEAEEEVAGCTPSSTPPVTERTGVHEGQREARSDVHVELLPQKGVRREGEGHRSGAPITPGLSYPKELARVPGTSCPRVHPEAQMVSEGPSSLVSLHFIFRRSLSCTFTRIPGLGGPLDLNCRNEDSMFSDSPSNISPEKTI